MPWADEDDTCRAIALPYCLTENCRGKLSMDKSVLGKIYPRYWILLGLTSHMKSFTGGEILEDNLKYNSFLKGRA